MEQRKANTLKFFSYFIIINLMFWGIVAGGWILGGLLMCIVQFSGWEILQLPSGHKGLKTSILLLFFPLAFSLILLPGIPMNLMLNGFIIVTVFDAFSQISGQLFGKRKLVPGISPGKTVEGLAGGLIAALTIAMLTGVWTDLKWFQILILGSGTALFSFGGDLSASWVKRRFAVKDFSTMLPGQGGFLDRFDSLFGASVFLHGFYQFLF